MCVVQRRASVAQSNLGIGLALLLCCLAGLLSVFIARLILVRVDLERKNVFTHVRCCKMVSVPRPHSHHIDTLTHDNHPALQASHWEPDDKIAAWMALDCNILLLLQIAVGAGGEIDAGFL